MDVINQLCSSVYSIHQLFGPYGLQLHVEPKRVEGFCLDQKDMLALQPNSFLQPAGLTSLIQVDRFELFFWFSDRRTPLDQPLFISFAFVNPAL